MKGLGRFLFGAILAFSFAASAVAAVAEAPAAKTGGAPCRVEIEAEPREAEVLLDGRPLAEYPGHAATEPGRQEVRLAPGDYVLEFSAPGYDTVLAPLAVREGDLNALVARSLSKTTGLALLKSDPAGAEITIDGVSYGTTPKLLADLPLGTWQATFSLPGYRETTIRFTLKDRAPVLAEARMVSDTATLRVTANVEGAKVKVNGAGRGVAPCTVERVPAGEIEVTASAPGYRDFTMRGRVAEGEELEIDAQLEPMPATLAVTSLPQKARVYLDNDYRGETPLELEGLKAGQHRLRVEKAGFDPMARNVTLARGAKATEEFRLKANTGRLAITSVPAGVTVFVDGVKAGETPAGETKDISGTLEIDGVAEGKRTLKFAKPGYFEKSAECEVKRGETTLQRVELQRRFIPNYEVVTATGSHKGVFVDETATEIKIETRPGITTTYLKADVLKHGALR